MNPKMILTFFFFALSCFGYLSGSSGEGNKSGQRFNVRQFGAMADGKTDDSEAFSKAIAAGIKSGKDALVFVPSGRYMLRTPMGGGMIQIKNASGFTLEGEKGTFLVSSVPSKHMINIDSSSNVIVSNFELDRNPFVFTQGVVDKIDTTLKTVEVTIDKGYDEPDAPLLQKLSAFLVFTDPKADTWDHSRWWPKIVSRERISTMKWKFTLSIVPLQTYQAKRFLIWNNVYKGWGVVANNSKDCLVENIKYYGGGADAGIGIWGCDGTITYKNFRTGIPEGSNRLIAAAGGSQEFENRATIVFDNVDVSRVDDDGFNMGTAYAKVLKQVDSRTIVVERKNTPYVVGDTIALWDWFLKKERSQAVLLRFTKNEDKTVTLVLDKNVEVLHPVGSPGLPLRSEYKGGGRFEEFDGIDRLADFQAAGKSIIRNSRFQNMRARCILLKTSNSIIENCTFYNTHMTAILAGTEFYWGEAPAIHNVIIRNNRFVNIDGCSINLGCFRSDNSYDNKNILIEGNTFENYGAKGGVGISGIQGTAVLIRNADGVIIRNNKFGTPASTAPKGSRPVVVEVSRNVKFENNIGIDNK
jgi:hypothetical protein